MNTKKMTRSEIKNVNSMQLIKGKICLLLDFEYYLRISSVSLAANTQMYSYY